MTRIIAASSDIILPSPLRL